MGAHCAGFGLSLFACQPAPYNCKSDVGFFGVRLPTRDRMTPPHVTAGAPPVPFSKVDFLLGRLNDAGVATKIVVDLFDDVDGTPAAETVTFALDGVTYAIELSADNACALRAALKPFVAAARRIGGRRSAQVALARTATAVNNRAVRDWAASNGVKVWPHGRIPAEVLDQYRAAGNELTLESGA